MGSAWWPNIFSYLKVYGFKGKKNAYPFFTNLIDIGLILFCLLFTTKNVYN